MLFLEHSPNTAMILGAALSGGDALDLARRLNDAINASAREAAAKAAVTLELDEVS